MPEGGSGWRAGDIIEFIGSFYNDVNVLTTPGTCTFNYYFTATPHVASPPSPTVLTYTGGTTPGAGLCVKIATGVMQAEVDTTGNPGFYTWWWETTGTAQVTSQAQQIFVGPVGS